MPIVEVVVVLRLRIVKRTRVFGVGRWIKVERFAWVYVAAHSSFEIARSKPNLFRRC